MKEFEVHVSVSYTTSGGSKERDCFLEYVDVKNATEAKRLVREKLNAEGFRCTRMEAIEV